MDEYKRGRADQRNEDYAIQLELENKLAEAQKLLHLKEQHGETWRDKPEPYWLARLLQEVWELAAALAGYHEHTPEFELDQIITICSNWRDMRARS